MNDHSSQSIAIGCGLTVSYRRQIQTPEGRLDRKVSENLGRTWETRPTFK